MAEQQYLELNGKRIPVELANALTTIDAATGLAPLNRQTHETVKAAITTIYNAIVGAYEEKKDLGELVPKKIKPGA
jgi:hypothetical protein